VGFLTATVARPGGRNFTEALARNRAIAASGFRRYSTYRQATVASVVTNSMFGFLRSYVMLAVAAATGTAAGYSQQQLLSFVWFGQGMIGVVMLWGWTDLSDRIRSGDVVMDLLRPQRPVFAYLAADFGRAGYALLTRFALPVVVGALAFGLYLPQRLSTYPLAAISIMLGVVVCFGCRFLTNAAGYWLLDSRGVMMLWFFLSGFLSGLYFPIRFLPEPIMIALWVLTPGPSILQTPLDVLSERDDLHGQLGLIGLQVVWVAIMLGLCQLVQRRAERRMVVQGG